MDIQPIRTEEDHTNALREIEVLWGAENGSPEGNKLDVLITLVDRYEDEHYPIGASHPIEVIKLHMEMTGRSQADLASLIGSTSRASEVLKKRRALTLDMVHKLNKGWGIPAECLITPYALERLHAYSPRLVSKAGRRTANPVRKRA
ncbi:transcriptional regulator [Neorhizobium galegae]|uniref:helix-turn-helix domain-containing protein n=1 Tax=Neorhizobium galegae TaxID=399 RepID=UPI0006226762|nr:transcriptional regulator [Neorhizobium galegae]MCQ1574222.1 transcriptional regulator [Neorhizobium galegae]MCQ1837602.1 transcriptional regulator [Neorhizobium galegae]CDZ67122.1 family transcriptional regulator protein [Neorhizobium galegae bv. orientalis]